jgi:GNAT superfamily N-acetyltransferase
MIAQALGPGNPRWPAFVDSLQAAGLPTDDLAAPHQRFFSFADGAGFGGFAGDGTSALLRSLIVQPARRGTGLGSAILTALLDEIRDEGVAEAWLLTLSAADFFARHGFRRRDRSDAPAIVRASEQFLGLCPASAVLMCRKPV